jgi:hypothetical protein
VVSTTLKTVIVLHMLLLGITLYNFSDFRLKGPCINRAFGLLVIKPFD